MKTKNIVLLIIGSMIMVLISCKTTPKGSGYVKADGQAKQAELQINLGAPINSADKNELDKSVYANKTYFLVQNKEDQFKDNAPFIQYLDGGKRERLWFTSSRADSLNYGNKRTNYYQQVYYCDREIAAGKCPGEGWSEPHLLMVGIESQLMKFKEYRDTIEWFNNATKGAVTIAENTMILSCDQMTDGVEREFKQLWSVIIDGNKFDTPQQLTAISNGKTWESQPSLSANGKHLFFVSNRKVNGASFNVNPEKYGTELNLFYSFNKNGTWQTPQLVKELYSSKNEITPHINLKGDKLYFSSDKDGDYEIYSIDMELNNDLGGYTLNTKTLQLFNRPLLDLCSAKIGNFEVNGEFNQKYPFYYFNPLNKKVPQAFFWASDNPKGMGSYDIYGCAMPFQVDLNVALIDRCLQGGNESIASPVIQISGALNKTETSDKASFTLFSGLQYQVKGGSTANLFDCSRDERNVFVGYSKLVNETNPEDKTMHTTPLTGASVNSEWSAAFEYLPIFDVLCDTTMNDTIFITKAWRLKEPCREVLKIPQKFLEIPYFQTGYWEVNTTANLKRDLAKLHEGFVVEGSNDMYNPVSSIKATRSGYRAFEWETPIPAINKSDKHTYSIADARWIELHPFNYYWGDREGFGSNQSERMKGRKKRIDEYLIYAAEVDTNLTLLTDTINNVYLNFLELGSGPKPKLLIEILATSDQREVLRGWYIGDTVQYRGSEYDKNGTLKEYKDVKIVPPTVDEKNKVLTLIKPCTRDFNTDGDNGSNLGINTAEDVDYNTNLSSLRAWFGYKEIFNRLAAFPEFQKYLRNNKVALPDNTLSYEDADIIITTIGKRDIKIEPTNPYAAANNPNGQGFYDYDKIRKVDIRIRLLYDKKDEVVKDFCCYGKK